ncbi:hypothetical protein SeMB42_g01194, partial [Synchytrium endobioticum]
TQVVVPGDSLVMGNCFVTCRVAVISPLFGWRTVIIQGLADHDKCVNAPHKNSTNAF